MHSPIRHAAAMMQCPLGDGPAIEAVLAPTEQTLIEGASFDRFDDIPRQIRQWQFQRTMVLGSLSGEGPGSVVCIQFAPCHAADFVAAGTGQNQKPDNPAIVIIGAGIPYSSLFGILQHPLTGRLGFRFIGESHRIDVNETLTNRPTKESCQH